MSSWDVYHMVEFMKNNMTLPLLTGRLARNPMIARIGKLYDGLVQVEPVVSGPAAGGDGSSSGSPQRQLEEDSVANQRELDHVNDTLPEYTNEQGHAFWLHPILQNFPDRPSDVKLAGVLFASMKWDWILSDLLPKGSHPIVVVVANTCGENVLSYSIEGPVAKFMGPSDEHNMIYDKKKIERNIRLFRGLSMDGELCEFHLEMYPTYELQQAYTSDNPIIFTAILAAVFACTAIFFFCYVRIVRRRQKKVMETAARTNAIVTSLFPSNVRERIMKDAENQANKQDLANIAAPFLPGMGEAPKMKLKSFLDDENANGSGESQLVMFQTKPIAGMYHARNVQFDYDTMFPHLNN